MIPKGVEHTIPVKTVLIHTLKFMKYLVSRAVSLKVLSESPTVLRLGGEKGKYCFLGLLINAM